LLLKGEAIIQEKTVLTAESLQLAEEVFVNKETGEFRVTPRKTEFEFVDYVTSPKDIRILRIPSHI
jgi:hypothetical protein